MLFVGDVMAYYFAKTFIEREHSSWRQLIYRRSAVLCCKRHVKPFKQTKLRYLLMQLAVEYLTQLRQRMLTDYGGVGPMVTTDYEAMYAYKCGRYEHCLRLCQENIKVLENHLGLSVLVFPESTLLQLIDDECFYFMAFVLLGREVTVSHVVTSTAIVTIFDGTMSRVKLNSPPSCTCRCTAPVLPLTF
jgi:hypothetical protein